MTGRPRPGQARLTLGWPGTGHAVAVWRAGRGNVHAAQCPGGKLAFAGDLVAADISIDRPHRLEIADVICCSGWPGNGKSQDWLSRTLERFPGCAVAAIMPDQWHVAVAPRANRPVAVPVRGNLPAEDVTLVCASFAYGWISSGWGIEWLRAGELRIAGGAPAVELSKTWGAAITPLPFGMSYRAAAPESPSFPGVRSARWRLTSAASGAPMPE